MISGFRRNVDEICRLLGYYTASCGNYLPIFWDNVSVPSSRVKSPTREDGTDTLSRNVGKQLPHDAIQYPRRPQISRRGPMLLVFLFISSKQTMYYVI
jgi:hypothetical protein